MDKKILEFLYNNFYKKGNYTQHRSLVDVFAKSSTVWNNQNSINELKSVIKRMVDNKWIHIDHSDFDTWGIIRQDETFNFRDSPINALLLEEGAKKIRQERVDNSAIKMNKATVINIFVAAVFTGIVIFLQIKLDKRDSKRTDREIQQEQQRVQDQARQEESDRLLRISLDSIRQAILIDTSR